MRIINCFAIVTVIVVSLICRSSLRNKSIYYTKHCHRNRKILPSLYDACNRQKQLTSSKENEADFWPSFDVGRKWKRTLTTGRHLSSETLLVCSYQKRICQPTKHAASAESALSRLNPSACVCLQLVPGLVARTIVFYRFLFCNHTHFGFVLLDFPLCRSASAWSLCHCSRCLRGRVSARASLFSRLSLIWGHSTVSRILQVFNSVVRRVSILGRQQRAACVWKNNPSLDK